MDKPAPIRVQDATTDQLAEAIAAGVHVGLRRLFTDLEAFTALRSVVEQVDDLPPRA